MRRKKRGGMGGSFFFTSSFLFPWPLRILFESAAAFFLTELVLLGLILTLIFNPHLHHNLKYHKAGVLKTFETGAVVLNLSLSYSIYSSTHSPQRNPEIRKSAFQALLPILPSSHNLEYFRSRKSPFIRLHFCFFLSFIL